MLILQLDSVRPLESPEQQRRALPVNESAENDGLTRRGFIKAVAAGAAGAALGAFGARALLRDAGAGGEASDGMTGPPVVDVRSPRWRVEGKADAAFIRKMVDYGVWRLTGKASAAEAWRYIAPSESVVGLLFNAEPGDYTGANAALVAAIADGLFASGVSKDKIIIVQAPGAGWQNAIAPDLKHRDQVEFAPAKTTRLTPFITDQVNVLINVPNLMDDRWGGIAGSLLNVALSPAIIKDPDLYRGGNCVAAAVGINALDVIRTKRHLNLVNGLIGVFDGGQRADDPQKQWPLNALLFAFDPVACDRVQLDILQQERKARALPDLFERTCTPIHIEKAARANLGCGNINVIKWIKAYDRA
jgi:hypothetical protein